CYLATSLICTTIFEGYGFGLFAKLQRYQLLYLVFSVWLFLLIASPIWLRHFRFGPMEWVWRSLTYWRKQPVEVASSQLIGGPKWRPEALVRYGERWRPGALVRRSHR